MDANQEYIITTDGDCHNFVIPADKKKEWDDYLDAVTAYWHQEFIEDDDLGPIQPSWADSVGGSPSLVRFQNYRIS